MSRRRKFENEGIRRSLFIQQEIDDLWERLAAHLGMSKVAVIETLLVERAVSEGLPLDKVNSVEHFHPKREHGVNFQTGQRLTAALGAVEGRAVINMDANALINLVSSLTQAIMLTPARKSDPVVKASRPSTLSASATPKRGRGRPRKATGAEDAVESDASNAVVEQGNQATD